METALKQDVIEQDTFGVSEEIINGFYQQWELFPDFVALIRKDRTIIALNKAARDMGYSQGIKCDEESGKELNNACMADSALEEGTTISKIITSKMPEPESTLIAYWMPLQDETDLYIHFIIDITGYVDPEKAEKADTPESITSSKFVQFSSNIFFKLFMKWRGRKNDE